MYRTGQYLSNPRYSSLVRRNFLRFGKRNGGSVSLLGGSDNPGARPQHDSFFNHLDRVPSAEVRAEKIKVRGFLVATALYWCSYTLEELKPQVKRARDYLRFGKREEMGTEDVGENDYIEDEELNFPVKRYGRRRISNFLRFGWFHLNLK